MTSPRYITLSEIARDRCYDLSDPRALANCREWLRRKGLRSTGGGRFLRDHYLVVMERVDRTPKAKATAAQQRARALNLAHGREQVRARSLHRTGVSGQVISQVHADESAPASSPLPLNRVAKEAHQ